MTPPLAIGWIPVIVGLCALSALAVVLLVVAPWSRVRREPPLDEDIETRLLLGEDPQALDQELEARRARRPPVAELRPDDGR